MNGQNTFKDTLSWLIYCITSLGNFTDPITCKESPGHKLLLIYCIPNAAATCVFCNSIFISY